MKARMLLVVVLLALLTGCDANHVSVLTPLSMPTVTFIPSVTP